MYPFMHPSTHPSVRLPIRPSIHACTHPSFCLSVCHISFSLAAYFHLVLEELIGAYKDSHQGNIIRGGGSDASSDTQFRQPWWHLDLPALLSPFRMLRASSSLALSFSGLCWVMAQVPLGVFRGSKCSALVPSSVERNYRKRDGDGEC